MKKKVTKIQDHYKEALRYLQNAEEDLDKRGKLKDGEYMDIKYVRRAGHTAWCAILVALDGISDAENITKRNYASYKKLIKTQQIREIYALAYSHLHITMGYEGFAIKETKKVAWQYAKKVINWAKTQYPKNITGALPLQKPCKKCGRAFAPEYKRIVNCKKCRR